MVPGKVRGKQRESEAVGNEMTTARSHPLHTTGTAWPSESGKHKTFARPSSSCDTSDNNRLDHKQLTTWQQLSVECKTYHP